MKLGDRESSRTHFLANLGPERYSTVLVLTPYFDLGGKVRTPSKYFYILASTYRSIVHNTGFVTKMPAAIFRIDHFPHVPSRNYRNANGRQVSTCQRLSLSRMILTTSSARNEKTWHSRRKVRSA